MNIVDANTNTKNQMHQNNLMFFVRKSVKLKTKKTLKKKGPKEPTGDGPVNKGGLTMTKRLEDIKFSDSYPKKELLEAIECLQYNYKGLKETYDRAVYVNDKLSEILKSYNIKMDWIKLERK